MMNPRPFLLAAALCAAPALSQNLIPNGDFEAGAAGWTNTTFNDPLGTTGVRPGRTTGNGPSNALFADFQTLTPVMSATWVSIPFLLPQGPFPIQFDVAWEKPVTTPIPSPSVNRVEVRIFDASNTQIFLGTQAAPNQSGTFERVRHNNTVNVPATGLHTIQVFMRHSNLANMPFINYVDNLVIGSLPIEVYGVGCAGAGSFVPVLNSINLPVISSNDFAIQLHDANAPTAALFALDVTNTSWRGLTLPFSLGGGCQILAGLTIQVPVPVTGTGAGNGTASVTLPIPNDPTLIGPDFYSQWFVVDAASGSPFGFATTAGLRFKLR